VAVSGRQLDEPDMGEIQVDDELGLQFIVGSANLLHYVVQHSETGEASLVKRTYEKLSINSRIPSMQLVPLTKEIPTAKVQIEIDYKKNQARIHYNGDTLGQNPFKLYFTREDDPSYLICTLHLDVNTLDELLKQKNLTTWPNPIVINLPTDDLSVYCLKTPQPISIVKKNVKARNNGIRFILPVV